MHGEAPATESGEGVRLLAEYLLLDHRSRLDEQFGNALLSISGSDGHLTQEEIDELYWILYEALTSVSMVAAAQQGTSPPEHNTTVEQCRAGPSTPTPPSPSNE
jgi:hypothetical protein